MGEQLGFFSPVFHIYKRSAINSPLTIHFAHSTGYGYWVNPRIGASMKKACKVATFIDLTKLFSKRLPHLGFNQQDIGQPEVPHPHQPRALSNFVLPVS